MRHGVLYCHRLGCGGFNVGDYIQGLAANQFMKGDVYLNRETLDEYHGEPVKLILNGWFMHQPEKFPPSEDIRPLFVSFHVSPSVNDVFFTPATVAYLRKHEPIGCRDRETVQKLEAHGIRAYFTGCLTLTLGRTYSRAPVESRRGVWFVDPLEVFTKQDVSQGRWWVLFHPLRAAWLFRRMKDRMQGWLAFHGKLEMLWRIGAFLRAYSTLFPWRTLKHAEYVSHVGLESWFTSIDERFAYADNLLKRYAQARFCVTSRIHCALPCVGMGVPVVFVNPRRLPLSGGRFEGLTDFFNIVDLTRRQMTPRFHVASPDGMITEETELPVSSSHEPLAHDLADRCLRFASLRTDFI